MSLLRISVIRTARQGFALRAISTSAVRNKTVVDSIKETADNVSKKVGKTLADGIDSAEKASENLKQSTSAKAPRAKKAVASSAEKAEKKAESARQKANRALGSAKGAARDAKDDVKKEL